MKKLVFVYLLMMGLAGCAERADQSPASVYVSIEDFTHQYEPGSTKALPVSVKIIGNETWDGMVKLALLQKDSILLTWEKSYSVLADTNQLQEIEIHLPEVEGVYHLVAEIQNLQGESVLSRRLIEVKKPIRVQIKD